MGTAPGSDGQGTGEPPVAHVTVEPLGIVLDVQPGETLIQAAWRHGYRWPTICGGGGSCGLCYIELDDGDDAFLPPDATERSAMAMLFASMKPERLARCRLACCARPVRDTTVTKRGVWRERPGQTPL